MAEIDPIILQLRADLARYKGELKATTVLVKQSLGSQERAIVGLEAQIKRSSAQIGGTLKGMAGALASALSAREIMAMADSYTRFTNQLRVAGLEGEKLAGMQERLFDVAKQNGVELEAVGTLYSRAAQNQKELGASTSDLIDLTRAVAASLRISGTSTQEASGALLQLGQALGSPRVQAEEFNSLLDTMQPLLREASKYIDGTGSSLSGLTRKIKDTKGPGVSNVELFRAITKAMKDLEEKAGGSALTISAAFTNLRSALVKYIGEADAANGASALMAEALGKLADNLDQVANAIAVIAAVVMGRYVAGMVAASAANGVVATSLFAIQARAAGAATGMEALALASRAAGASLLTVFGGPIGLAVTALAIAIGYAVTRTDELSRAAKVQEEAQRKAANVTKTAADAADKLASAHGKARTQALAAAKAEAENVKQKIASAKASALLATVEAMRARQSLGGQFDAAAQAAPKSGTGSGVLAGALLGSLPGAEGAAQAREAADAANEYYFALERRYGELLKQINAAESPITKIEDDEKKKEKKKTGPTEAEIRAQFESDLRRQKAEQLQDELAITTDAERRRELSSQLDDIEFEERKAQIENEKYYTKAQKAALIAALNRQFGRGSGQGDDIVVAVSARGIARQRELEEAQRRQKENQLAIERDALEAEAANATTRKQRLDIERRILALQQQEERSRLEAAIAAGDIADAAQARADLERKQSADRTATERAGEGPLGDLRREFEDLDTAIEQVEANALRRLREGLTQATVKALGLKGALGDIVGELIRIGIQRQIIGPLADALFGAATGGTGGIVGGVIGSLFGRASGGYVGPGQTVRVNESRGGVELLRMGPQGGTVIPLGQTKAARPTAAPIINQTFVLDARHGITTPELLNHVENVRRDALGAAAAMGQGVMKAMPARLAQYQRDGT